MVFAPIFHADIARQEKEVNHCFLTSVGGCDTVGSQREMTSPFEKVLPCLQIEL